jgi:CysZ protein
LSGLLPTPYLAGPGRRCAGSADPARLTGDAAMFAAFAKSLGQLSDPAIMKIVWKSTLFSLLMMIVLVVGVWFLLGWLRFVDWAWLEGTIDVLGGLGAVFVAWILFPVAATAIVGFYLEDVADAVDLKHYPRLPDARRQSVAEAVRSTVSFAFVAIGLNLLLLPVYAVLLFFPPANYLLFLAVNGYLIGREYFEVVAFRRLDPARAKSLRRAHPGQIFFAGALVAFLFTIPLVNLIMPVVATMFMVHLFNSLPQTTERT